MKRNRRSKTRNATILAAAVALLMTGPLFVLATHGDQEPVIERELPDSVSCGEAFQVDLLIQWNNGNQVFIEETVPNGWSILHASNGGKIHDGTVPTVKWAIEQDGSATESLTYTLRADTTHTGIEYLGGSFRHTGMGAEEHNISFHGDTEIVVAGCATRTVHHGATFTQTETVECGETLQVLLEVTPPDGNALDASWLVDEVPPQGVDVNNVDRSNKGEYLAAMHRVKWVSLDGDGALLTYKIQVDDDHAPGTLDFDGQYRLHPYMEERGLIQGIDTIQVTCAGHEGPGDDDHNETDDLDNLTDGQGGGGSDRTSRSPPVLLQALARQKPQGALAAYGTNATDLEAGRKFVIEMDDPYVSKIEVVPSSDASGEQIEVVRWPATYIPDGTPDLPRALEPHLLLEIKIGEGHQDDHDVTFHLRLDQADVDTPEHVVLVRENGAGWTYVDQMDLGSSGDRYEATVQSPCCSLFSAVTDQERPTLTLIAPPGGLSGTVTVQAESSDNLHVQQVEFLLDDEPLSTDESAPFTHELNVEDHEPGTYRLTAVATDGAGNTATEHRTLRFEPNGDSPSTQAQLTENSDEDEGPVLWPLVGVIGASGLVGIGYAGRSTVRSLVARRLDWDWEWRW